MTADALPPGPGAVVIALEHALIERVRRGEGAAFREVFRLHVVRVRGFLRHLLGSASAADEATQETFVRAHAALRGGAEVERLQPWLLGIARNTAREHRRAQQRDVALADTVSEQGSEPVAALDPEALLLGREASAVLARALDTLSEERRAALVLRADQALAYEDIALVLGWNVARVKNEIYRARLQLRAALVTQLEPSEIA